MVKIFFLCIISTLLLAQNPKTYSSLGDILYDNSLNIEKLKEIDIYTQYGEKIEEYLSDIKSVKELGFEVDRADNSDEKKRYLNRLRELSKTNDFFVKSVNSNFFSSIKSSNSKLFLQMVNSKMLDTEKYRSEILKYYNLHSDEITPFDIMQDFLATDKKVQNKVSVKQSDKKRQEEKISRIRESDKINQETMEKSLEEETAKKKNIINDEKMKELNN
ncbi:MAG: hypothetical protein WC667_01580 [Sulfurimonas sp.]|jgi:hypothetical protein